MLDETLVIDASVIAKCFFFEVGSEAALAVVYSGVRLIAPDLIFAEIASIAAKYVRRHGMDHDLARRAIVGLPSLLDQTPSLESLAENAFDLAARHGFSAYDGAYLALARARGLQMITADGKLARKAADCGFAHHVRLLTPES